MTGVDRSRLAAVAAEIGARRGSRVRSVHQDGRYRFRISLDGTRGRTDVVLDLDPDYPRIHLAAPTRAPDSPTPLASGFRRAIRGARLEGTFAVPGERAVALAFTSRGKGVTVWFEGFGRAANLYVVDAGGIVRLTPRGEVAARRGARVGQRFKPIAPQASARGDDQDAAPSDAVREAAARHARARDLEQLRARILRQVARDERRLAKRVERLETMGRRGRDAARLRRRGELLRASFHLIRPGADSVRVPDLGAEAPSEVEIQLDPRKSPGDQVAACFREARKSERAESEAQARLPEARASLEVCLATRAMAEKAEDVASLEAIAERAGIRLAEPADRSGKKPPRAQPWRAYLSADGWRILVGRDAKGNDRLTVGEAKPSDLFLHVRGTSGSHVIVPTPRGKSVPKETLLDAAELAVFFSQRRGADWCEVDYVLKRYVRKPRRSPAGTVVVERARTLRIRPSDDRRRRVLATRRK